MSGNHRPNDPLGTWSSWHITEPCDECTGSRKSPPAYTPHETTMLPNQRRELVRMLGSSYPISAIANLTDRQLHEQWLADCEYPNGVEHVSSLPLSANLARQNITVTVWQIGRCEDCTVPLYLSRADGLTLPVRDVRCYSCMRGKS